MGSRARFWRYGSSKEVPRGQRALCCDLAVSLALFSSAGEAARQVHDPGLGVAVERACAASPKHLVPFPGGAFGRGGIPRKDCSTGFFGLAEGLCLSLKQVSLSMSCPDQACGFVQSGAVSSAGCGLEELVRRSPDVRGDSRLILEKPEPETRNPPRRRAGVPANSVISYEFCNPLNRHGNRSFRKS